MGRSWAGFCLAVIVALGGCSGGEMPLAEYAARVTAIVDRASQQYEALVGSPQGEVLIAEAEQLADYTPRDLQMALERQRHIEDEVMEDIDAIEPPAQVAELHQIFFYSDYFDDKEALASRAGTAADWEELSESPEMAAYRAVLAQDKQACAEFQAQLDTIGGRGILAATPWLRGELTGVVEAVLGCGVYPEHPEDVYRPPAGSVP